jgi:tol-pal system beta propeller repeat protein TolB
MLQVKKIVYRILFGGACCMTMGHSAAELDSQTLAAAQGFSFQIDTSSQIFSKVNCLMLCIGQQDIVYKVGKTVKFDLEFTDQLDVELKKAEAEPEAKVLPKLFEKGTSLCLFLKAGKTTNSGCDIEVTLKEPSANQVVFNHRFMCNDKNIIYTSHSIAHELFPVLTGQPAPVLSTLAYCKQLSPKNKILCISDYACRKERMLFESHTINLAPRWHSKVPMLFYSQLTRSNNRLMSYDLKSGQQRVVCSYDGLNMQPSFSVDGTRVVLCLSAGTHGNSEIFLYDQRECNRLGKRVFTQLTNNGGNNASPTLLPNEDVIFCSDFESGSPQIYYLDRKNNLTRRLTNGYGYCTAPSYCTATGAIVYNRFTKGYFQLFTMSLNDKNKVERQLTVSAGDKQEPVWSNCGRYVAFSYDCKEKGEKYPVSQIAVLNMASKKIKVLTSGREHKSFPCWVNEPYYA